ncbi:hypothetical protein HKX48_007200, partial [Thoreauomyces humboldtii]
MPSVDEGERDGDVDPTSEKVQAVGQLDARNHENEEVTVPSVQGMRDSPGFNALSLAAANIYKTSSVTPDPGPTTSTEEPHSSDVFDLPMLAPPPTTSRSVSPLPSDPVEGAVDLFALPVVGGDNGDDNGEDAEDGEISDDGYANPDAGSEGETGSLEDDVQEESGFSHLDSIAHALGDQVWDPYGDDPMDESGGGLLNQWAGAGGPRGTKRKQLQYEEPAPRGGLDEAPTAAKRRMGVPAPAMTKTQLKQEKKRKRRAAALERKAAAAAAAALGKERAAVVAAQRQQGIKVELQRPSTTGNSASASPAPAARDQGEGGHQVINAFYAAMKANPALFSESVDSQPGDEDLTPVERQHRRVAEAKRAKQKKEAQRREDLFRTYAASTPCEFWQAGRCQLGDQCPYSHAGEGSNFLDGLPCRFFKSGSCKAGDDCKWSHDLKKEPCVFHHLERHKAKGCVKGDACPFSHDPMTEEQKKRLDHEEERYAARAAATQAAATASANIKEEGEDDTDGVSSEEEGAASDASYSLNDRGAPIQPVGPPPKLPCVFFHLKQHTGGCWKGDRCMFSHDPLTPEALEELREQQTAHDRRFHPNSVEKDAAAAAAAGSPAPASNGHSWVGKKEGTPQGGMNVRPKPGQPRGSPGGGAWKGNGQQPPFQQQQQQQGNFNGQPRPQHQGPRQHGQHPPHQGHFQQQQQQQQQNKWVRNQQGGPPQPHGQQQPPRPPFSQQFNSMQQQMPIPKGQFNQGNNSRPSPLPQQHQFATQQQRPTPPAGGKPVPPALGVPQPVIVAPSAPPAGMDPALFQAAMAFLAGGGGAAGGVPSGGMPVMPAGPASQMQQPQPQMGGIIPPTSGGIMPAMVVPSQQQQMPFPFQHQPQPQGQPLMPHHQATPSLQQQQQPLQPLTRDPRLQGRAAGGSTPTPTPTPTPGIATGPTPASATPPPQPGSGFPTSLAPPAGAVPMPMSMPNLQGVDLSALLQVPGAGAILQLMADAAAAAAAGGGQP